MCKGCLSENVTYTIFRKFRKNSVSQMDYRTHVVPFGVSESCVVHHDPRKKILKKVDFFKLFFCFFFLGRLLKCMFIGCIFDRSSIPGCPELSWGTQKSWKFDKCEVRSDTLDCCFYFNSKAFKSASAVCFKNGKGSCKRAKNDPLKQRFSCYSAHVGAHISQFAPILEVWLH